MKFIKCDGCGRISAVLTNGDDCDGKKELKPNTTDAANEKHVPYVVSNDGKTLTVQIGETIHPMLPEHHIEWIYVETKTGGLMKKLEVGKDPVAIFNIEGEEVVSIYEHCNLHGLWEKIV